MEVEGFLRRSFLQYDYSWVVGDYTSCTRSAMVLKEGNFLQTEETASCPESQSIEIAALGSPTRFYQLILTAIGRPCLHVDQLDCKGATDIWHVFEGIGSYNPKFKDEITFFSDHLEYLNGDGEWGLASDTNDKVEDVDTFVCTKASLDGDTIVCDGHINRMLLGGHFQMVGTFVLSEGSVAVENFIEHDHSWVVGDYPSCTRSFISLKKGNFLQTEEVQPCAAGQSYKISALGNSTRLYQLILTAIGRPCLFVDQLDCDGATDMRPRTQMTAVNQKLLPVIYFSPENVPFAQKKGIKIPGRPVTKK